MVKRCKFYRECKKTAVTFVPYSKMPLCKTHFLKYIEDRVWKTITEHNLIEITPDEKILVGLSGGKDSQTLLTLLHKVLKGRVGLEALYIEVGISPRDYSRDSEVVARQLCEKLDIPFHVVDTKAEYGYTIDQIHQIGKRLFRGGKSRKRSHFRGECSYCGLLKRYSINHFAAKNGFTKVATGHNLTDEATTLLSNFFNVDIELMSRAGPTTITNAVGLIPRIKPLYYIYEKETILYAYYADVAHLPTECEYSLDSPMLKLKRSLNKVETIRRGNMMNMMHKYQQDLKPMLFAKIPEHKTTDNQCDICGMPTYLDTCAFCKTKARVMGQLEKLKNLPPWKEKSEFQKERSAKREKKKEK